MGGRKEGRKKGGVKVERWKDGSMGRRKGGRGEERRWKVMDCVYLCIFIWCEGEGEGEGEEPLD